MLICHLPKFLVLLLLLLLCGSEAGAASASREGILLVAFGTSVPEAKSALEAVDQEYRRAFPGAPIVWAYTSQIIRKKLARQGINVDSIGQGLARLAQQGVKIVRVQSLHLMAGEEFAALARSVLLNIQKKPKQFEAVYLGRPLLESRQDAEETGAAILGEMARQRQKGEALVLMGHGQEHGRADLIFEGMRSVLKARDPLAFLATVEGSRTFEEMAELLGKSPAKKIWLMPLMLVAGDHARNDLAGMEADSWASRLKARGYEVQTNLKGLGEVPGIARIFIRHTKESSDDLLREPRKP